MPPADGQYRDEPTVREEMARAERSRYAPTETATSAERSQLERAIEALEKQGAIIGELDIRLNGVSRRDREEANKGSGTGIPHPSIFTVNDLIEQNTFMVNRLISELVI